MPLRRRRSLRHLGLLIAATGVITGLAAAAGAGPFDGLAGHPGVSLVAEPITTPSPAPLRADALYPPLAPPAARVALTYVTDPPPPQAAPQPTPPPATGGRRRSRPGPHLSTGDGPDRGADAPAGPDLETGAESDRAALHRLPLPARSQPVREPQPLGRRRLRWSDVSIPPGETTASGWSAPAPPAGRVPPSASPACSRRRPRSPSRVTVPRSHPRPRRRRRRYRCWRPRCRAAPRRPG